MNQSLLKVVHIKIAGAGVHDVERKRAMPLFFSYKVYIPNLYFPFCSKLIILNTEDCGSC